MLPPASNKAMLSVRLLGISVDLNILAFISSNAFVTFWHLTLLSIGMNHALIEYLGKTSYIMKYGSRYTV